MIKRREFIRNILSSAPAFFFVSCAVYGYRRSNFESIFITADAAGTIYSQQNLRVNRSTIIKVDKSKREIR